MRAKGKLQQSIEAYLRWMVENGYSRSTWYNYAAVLKHFQAYVKRRKIPWNRIFTFATEHAFACESGLTHVSAALRGLSRYLYQQQQIARPIQTPRTALPRIYEQYIQYYQDSRAIRGSQLYKIRNTLSALNAYLSQNHIDINAIGIEHLDAFFVEHDKALVLVSRQKERSRVRGFLRYLAERQVIRKNLAPLLVSAPDFAQANPPRFLRPEEIKTLLSCVNLDSCAGLRTYAMIHLAFSLGLRPCEISSIRLDDIAFQAGEIALHRRKNETPIRLPLGENTLKAVVAYVVNARPKSRCRALFLNLNAPFAAVSAATVSHRIGTTVRHAGLNGSAYALRHSYAQTLLEQGVSIFQIKQMMGHDRIQTTRRYLHIDLTLMRKVLFDETV